jgi:4-hydroxy-3-polyprenylbenzoate decarboxylase
MSDEQSIRPFLAALERDGQLLRIDKTVDTRYELSAFLSAADPGPAVLFERVAGSDLCVAGNLLTGRSRIAAALGIGTGEIQPLIRRSIHEPLAPVRAATGAAQEIVVEQAPLAGLPVPTFFEHETRPYITAGVILARDPDTQRGNLSFARLAILDERRAMVGIAPNHHLALFARRAAAAGRTLEIVVAIGAHPAIQLAACLYLGVGDDELECAGRLLGAPVRLVAARTVSLMVPADAEVVLEGEIDANTPIAEGLVSEYHGMYEDYGPGFLVTFRAQTRRRDAIFQVIEPGYHREHIYLGALPIAAVLTEVVSAVASNVRDLAVTEAGAGRTDVVVQLAAPQPGQAQSVIRAVFSAMSIVKRVTVVDNDIDPWDASAVEWARANRMKVERDLLLVPLARAVRSEPMEEGGRVTKIGFDATARPDDRSEGCARALPPRANVDAARRWLVDNLPATRRPWLRN